MRDRAEIKSALVRRLIRARNDPGKQRLRTWLAAIDDRDLRHFGLTPAEIAALRAVSAA